MRLYYFILLSALSILASCRRKDPLPHDRHRDRAGFEYYIRKGNEAYAVKSGPESITTSQAYFDSARQIAYQLNDSILIAKTIYAQGRIYDAWNKDPEKTIAYFREAAHLYKGIDSLHDEYLFIRHLVAHAYEKNHDSVHAAREIQALYNETVRLDAKKKAELKFLPELALISTEVGNYTLARKILDSLIVPQSIRNDPYTYDYRDHYLLTKARIQVFDERKPPYNYLDSLVRVFDRSRNSSDSIYYSGQLSHLFDATGNIGQAYKFLLINTGIYSRINTKAEFDTLSKRLAYVEAQSETQKDTLNRKSNQLWIIIISCLFLFIIGSMYTNLIFRRSSNKYYKMSKELESAIDTTNLLYKELHHRIKNNLHMIFSLLQMQERRSDNPVTIDNLRSARLRIESIAVMHEEMMRPEIRMDFRNFLYRMIQSITECFTFNRQIVTQIRINDVEIPQNHSFAVALIVNEWISNSIKHAITSEKSLEIFIDIFSEGNKIVIDYYDNGETTQKIRNRDGLGSQIIQLLAKQLKAEFIQSITNPYHYTIKLAKS